MEVLEVPCWAGSGFGLLDRPPALKDSGQAAPVAFIAGVVGPLAGADLLHLKNLNGKAVGMTSTGGAGTFDGIMLSGVVVAHLA